MQGRSENGRFAAKSDEHRVVRSVRLTDSTWEVLGELAQSQGLTRGDLLEDLGLIIMGASGKPFLSGRIPQELWNAVNAHAKEAGKTRTDIMIEAVCAYLNLPTPNAPNEQRIEELERRMAELEDRLEQAQKPSMPSFSDFFSEERVNKHYGNGKSQK
ncbi:hypothetical protein H6G36_25515 [Anabaena minutissima FACHB-250]|nr:hypothetical protein [Anabaena minutissima FACHB-250]